MPLHLDLIPWKRKKELEGKQFWRFSQSFFEASLITCSHVWGPRTKLYYFWLGSYVLLTESNLSDQYFVDWLHCYTLIARYHPH